MTTDLPVFPLDHLPLFGRPEAAALVIRDRVISFEMLNLRIGRLAAWLKAHDFAPGDRVATWLGKTEIACIMPLAAVRAGYVHVPINPQLKAAQVRHILADSGARLALSASLELQRRGGRYALCTMCIGVGQGIAMILERV